MSQTGVVTRLALRELWISFRLLALLAVYVGAGAFVALLPAPMATVLVRLAIGVAARDGRRGGDRGLVPQP